MGKKVRCCAEEGGSYRPCNRGDNSKHKSSGLWLTPGLDTSKPFPFTTHPQNAHTPTWHFIQSSVASDFVIIKIHLSLSLNPGFWFCTRLSVSVQKRKHVSSPPVYRKVLETIDLIVPNRIQAVSENKEKEPICILCLVSKLFLHITHVFHSLESWLSR